MKKLNSNFFIVFIVLALFLTGGLFLIKEFSNFGKLIAGPERCCGNGELDFNEECDISIPDAATLAASTYATADLDDWGMVAWKGGGPDGWLDGNLDQNGFNGNLPSQTVDVDDYDIMMNNCTADCKFICPPIDPNFVHIDEGCYDPDGVEPCQKGRWICVTEPASPDYQTVICHNVYNDPASPEFLGWNLFDYCCDSDAAELIDGDINGVPFEIVKASVSDLQSGATGVLGFADLAAGTWGGGPPLAGFGAGIGFKCDAVCGNVGKICVGVGLTDPSIDSCIYIRHDTGAAIGGCNNDGKNVISLQLPANQASTNCSSWFAMFYYSNRGGANKHWSTGYDKYEYHCEKYDPGGYWEAFSPATFNFNDVPVGSEGVCKPLAPDTCEFHGFDLIETACYCL